MQPLNEQFVRDFMVATKDLAEKLSLAKRMFTDHLVGRQIRVIDPPAGDPPSHAFTITSKEEMAATIRISKEGELFVAVPGYRHLVNLKNCTIDGVDFR